MWMPHLCSSGAHGPVGGGKHLLTEAFGSSSTQLRHHPPVASPFLALLLFFFFLFKDIYLFIWLRWVLVAACRIFSCGMRTLTCCVWNLVPLPGIEPGPPVLGAWSLNHWTTREVPPLAFLYNSFHNFTVFFNNYFIVVKYT